jgi:hypothetical protein
MQRRVRITLAVTAAAGALALGAGTAFADPADAAGGASNLQTPQLTQSGVNPGTLPSADQLGAAQQQLGQLGQAPAASDATPSESDATDAAPAGETSSLVNTGSNSTPLDGVQK